MVAGACNVRYSSRWPASARQARAIHSGGEIKVFQDLVPVASHAHKLSRRHSSSDTSRSRDKAALSDWATVAGA
jgi:hypothetical protein